MKRMSTLIFLSVALVGTALGFSLQTQPHRLPLPSGSSLVRLGPRSSPKPAWRHPVVVFATESEDGSEEDDDASIPKEDGDDDVAAESTQKLTFKQKLAKAGLSVMLSYGWVSTSSAAILWSAAWYIHCKRTQLSPLAQGQWKPFLAVYAGFWVFNNIIRPLRFALALSLSRFFDGVILAIQNRFNVSKQRAIGLAIFLFNVVGTTCFFALGILTASVASGVPIF